MVDVEPEVRSLLQRTAESGSPNALKIESAKALIVEIEAMYAEDYAGREEELRDKRMWDLVAADAAPTHDAHFLAVVISREVVRFAAGRGNGVDVRRFADSEFPSDPVHLVGELQQRFPSTETLELPRSGVDAWARRR